MVWGRRTSVAPLPMRLSWRGPALIMWSSAALLFPAAWFMSAGALIWPGQTSSSDHQVGPETLALSPINELKKQKGTAAAFLFHYFVSKPNLQPLPRTLFCHRQTKIVCCCCFACLFFLEEGDKVEYISRSANECLFTHRHKVPQANMCTYTGKPIRFWTRHHKLSGAPSTSQPLSRQEPLQYLNATQFYLQAFKMCDVYFMGTECIKAGRGGGGLNLIASPL